MLKRFKHTILLVFVLFVVGDLIAQSFKNPEEYAKQADKYFENGDFTTAYTFYQTLRSNNPEDPTYNFRLGVCMMYSEPEDKTRPIFYLQKAIDYKVEDNRVFYFLGRALHNNYRFLEAQNSYKRYKEIAKERSIKSFDIDRRIAECENGIALLSHIKLLYVVDKQLVKSNTFYKSYKLPGSKAKIVAVPEIFRTKLDFKKGAPPFGLFIPKTSVLYFVSYGAKGEQELDIFSSLQSPTGEWGEAINLGESINTPYDDAYPFVTDDGTTFYFSSKGHNSMGGYDIFKIDNNEITNGWSNCENLNFPVNTPFDDIFFVPDTAETLAYFSSDRQSLEGQIYVYHIGLNKQEQEQDLAKVFRDGGDATDLVKLLKDIAELKTNINVEDYKKQIPKTEIQTTAAANIDTTQKTEYKTYIKREAVNNEALDKMVAESYNTYKKIEYQKIKLQRQKAVVSKIIADNNKLSTEYKIRGDQQSINEVKSLDNANKVAKEISAELEKQIVILEEASQKILIQAGNIQRFAGLQYKDSVTTIFNRIQNIEKSIVIDNSTIEKIVTQQEEVVQSKRDLASKKYAESQEALKKNNALIAEINEYKAELANIQDEEEKKEYTDMIALLEQKVIKNQALQNKLDQEFQRFSQAADSAVLANSDVSELLQKFTATQHKPASEAIANNEIAAIDSTISNTQNNIQLSIIEEQAVIAKNVLQNNIESANNAKAENQSNNPNQANGSHSNQSNKTNIYEIQNQAITENTLNQKNEIEVSNLDSAGNPTNEVADNQSNNPNQSNGSHSNQANKTNISETQNQVITENALNQKNEIAVSNLDSAGNPSNEVADSKSEEEQLKQKLESIVGKIGTKKETILTAIQENEMKALATNYFIQKETQEFENKENKLNQLIYNFNKSEQKTQLQLDEIRLLKMEILKHQLAAVAAKDLSEQLAKENEKYQSGIDKLASLEFKVDKFSMDSLIDSIFTFEAQLPQVLNAIPIGASISTFAKSDQTKINELNEIEKLLQKKVSEIHELQAKSDNLALSLDSNAINDLDAQIILKQEQIQIVYEQKSALESQIQSQKIKVALIDSLENVELESEVSLSQLPTQTENNQLNQWISESDNILNQLNTLERALLDNEESTSIQGLLLANNGIQLQQISEDQQARNLYIEIEELQALELDNMLAMDFESPKEINLTVNTPKEISIEELNNPNNSDNSNQIISVDQIPLSMENVFDSVELAQFDTPEKIAQVEQELLPAVNTLNQLSNQQSRIQLDLARSLIIEKDYRNAASTLENQITELNEKLMNAIYDEDIESIKASLNTKNQQLIAIKRKVEIASLSSALMFEHQQKLITNFESLSQEYKANKENIIANNFDQLRNNAFLLADAQQRIDNPTDLYFQNLYAEMADDSLELQDIVNDENELIEENNNLIQKMESLEFQLSEEDKEDKQNALKSQIQVAQEDQKNILLDLKILSKDKAKVLGQLTESKNIIAVFDSHLYSINNSTINVESQNAMTAQSEIQPIASFDHKLFTADLSVKVDDISLTQLEGNPNAKNYYYPINSVDLMYYSKGDVERLQRMLLKKQRISVDRQIEMYMNTSSNTFNVNEKVLLTEKINELNQVNLHLDSNLAKLESSMKRLGVNYSTTDNLNAEILVESFQKQADEYLQTASKLQDTAKYFDPEHKAKLLDLAQSLVDKSDTIYLALLEIKVLASANNYYQQQIILADIDFQSLNENLSQQLQQLNKQASEKFILADETRVTAFSNNTVAEKKKLIQKANSYELEALAIQEKAINLWQIETQQTVNQIKNADTNQAELNANKQNELNNNPEQAVNQNNNAVTNQAELNANKPTKYQNIKTIPLEELFLVDPNELNPDERFTYEVRKAESIGIYVGNLNPNPNITTNNLNLFNNPIEVNAALPQGLIFMVQIAAFKAVVPSNSFGELTPITASRFPNSEYIRYYAGLFTNFKDANQAKNIIRTKNFKDAFVVAFFNGQPISIIQARAMIDAGTAYTDQGLVKIATQLEIEHYGAAVSVTQNATNEIPAINSKQGLLYTVRVGVFGGPRTAERLGIQDNLFFDRTANGNYRYYVGVYQNEDNAIGARNQIRGTTPYKDAFVVAFYNGNTIALNEARNMPQTPNTEAINQNPMQQNLSNQPQPTKPIISFKVQLGAYKTVRQGAQLQLLESISLNGLDVYTNANGLLIYSTKAINSFEEAIVVQNNIRAKGNTDVFVVAFENEKRITINQAKEKLNQ